MGGAIATFTPTRYMEPFCGVHVESMMTGTPVITSNWGVFTETVGDGFNGFRCDVLNDYVQAARMATDLPRERIREYALTQFSVDVVRFQYDAYFRRLGTLKRSGWYELEDLSDRARAQVSPFPGSAAATDSQPPGA